MSNIINSLLIEPVVRQARRFSTPEPRGSSDHVPQDHEGPSAGPQTHARCVSSPLGRGTDPDCETLSKSRSRSPDGRPINTPRDPEVARHNGFQGLIPLDDVRSEYVFSESPVESRAASPEPHDALSAESDSSASDVRGTALPVGTTRSIQHGHTPSQSLNPSYTSVPGRLLPPRADTSSASTGRDSVDSVSLQQATFVDDNRSDTISITGSMSSKLPEDDGMKTLRDKMHDIHDMALSTGEKAKKMHALMVSDYTAFKQQQLRTTTNQADSRPREASTLAESRRSRSNSRASTSSAYSAEAVFDVRLENVETTFWPHSVPVESSNLEEDEQDALEHEPVFGCKHYMRNIKVQCTHCRRWYTCDHCHDEMEDHPLVRKNIRYMLCMYCGHPQKAGDHCRECEEEAATYYCDICKLWDNDASKSIYHCPDCGICRKGEGLGKDYIHCKRCNVCVSINHASDHRCIERATECDCPICGEYMFSSLAAVVAMRCGHYIHRECYNAYMRTSYKCPTCSRSAVNMELQWRKMDLCLESQPMPESYRDTQVWIICNDCTMRSCVPFHWLGNKCRLCDSYNTNQIKIVSSDQPLEPQIEERRAAHAVEAAQANGTIPDGLAPDLLPSTGPTGRPRQQTGPARISAQDSRLQRAMGVVPDAYESPLSATQVSSSSIHRERQDDRSPPRRSSDPVRSRRLEALTPSQPLPISIHSRSNIDIARMTSAAASAAASARASNSDDDDVSVASEAESEDSTTFWGGSISPPNISFLPAGWTSPRLFASSPASSPANDDAGESGNIPAPSSWGINPGTWRLNSPHLFGSAPAEAADLDSDEEEGEASSTVFPTSWHPSQWHIGSPHEYFFGSSSNHAAAPAATINGQDEAVAATLLPSFPAGWHPSHWRLGSPNFFSGEVDPAVQSEQPQGAHTNVSIDESENEGKHRGPAIETVNEGGLFNLNIRPRFLAERFGSFSSGGGVPLPWARGEDVKDVEGCESTDGESTGEEEEEESESETEGQRDEGDDEDEDELDLPGHR